MPYASVCDSVNELAGRFRGIGARIIPSADFRNIDGQVAARLLGLTDTPEMEELAGVDILAPSSFGGSNGAERHDFGSRPSTTMRCSEVPPTTSTTA